ncbi:hypothetical protein OPV22_032827 [Ensete ventricosum]|uniref:Uncharacterized protein n=1 Tax=Ensete ventricosum TaxID=4639 RepID=A0AAV8PNG4_ENSVE|nr:hypothetical protein OPV22_032827 [Ensete ventricosum]
MAHAGLAFSFSTAYTASSTAFVHPLQWAFLCSIPLQQAPVTVATASPASCAGSFPSGPLLSAMSGLAPLVLPSSPLASASLAQPPPLSSNGPALPRWRSSIPRGGRVVTAGVLNRLNTVVAISLTVRNDHRGHCRRSLLLL